MRVGLRCDDMTEAMVQECYPAIQKKVGIELEVVVERQNGIAMPFLCLKRICESLEDGSSDIEEVEAHFFALVGFSSNVWLRDTEDKEFISVLAYAIRCERRKNLWRRAATLHECV